jgi:hypothetical protein
MAKKAKRKVVTTKGRQSPTRRAIKELRSVSEQFSGLTWQSGLWVSGQAGLFTCLRAQDAFAAIQFKRFQHCPDGLC